MTSGDQSTLDQLSLIELPKEIEYSDEYRRDMNKLVLNYLVTEGYKEAAEKFQLESGLTETIDMQRLDDEIKIRDAIYAGNIPYATATINRLHPELFDDNRYLYFHLQQLHVIELIRNAKLEEALEFAQSHLSEAGETNRDVLFELERTLALLAFDNPLLSPYSELLKLTYRKKIVNELNMAILKLTNNEMPVPRLGNLIQLIVWSQDHLDKRNMVYSKMTDYENTTIVNFKRIVSSNSSTNNG